MSFEFIKNFTPTKVETILKTLFEKDFEHKNTKGALFLFLKMHQSAKTLKDFPLIILKEKILEKRKFSFPLEKKKVESLAGIYNGEQLKNVVRGYPKYSFIIWVKFKLKQPYFSKDENDFYIIQNPIIKDTAFKVPLIRASSWKGAIAHAFRELINEASIEKKYKLTQSFFRIFGIAPSESLEAIIKYLKRENLEKTKEKLIEFILFELGLEIDQSFLEEIEEKAKTLKGLTELVQDLIGRLGKSSTKGELTSYPYRGRAIFYPTFFDTLSLEVINPHDRIRRAGTKPIHYEVVPKETEGVLQIVYIPLDGITMHSKKLQEQVKQDLENLIKAIKKASTLGVGAKTKLGWGTFYIQEAYFCLKEELMSEFSIEGWEKCL